MSYAMKDWWLCIVRVCQVHFYSGCYGVVLTWMGLFRNQTHTVTSNQERFLEHQNKWAYTVHLLRLQSWWISESKEGIVLNQISIKSLFLILLHSFLPMVKLNPSMLKVALLPLVKPFFRESASDMFSVFCEFSLVE